LSFDPTSLMADGVRDVVKNAKRKCEIKRAIRERDITHARKMKCRVRDLQKILPRNREGVGAGIQQMQMPYSRSNQNRPPPTAAAKIEAYRVGRQRLPGGKCENMNETSLRGPRPKNCPRPAETLTLHDRIQAQPYRLHCVISHGCQPFRRNGHRS
jgi:hypothetical protein